MTGEAPLVYLLSKLRALDSSCSELVRRVASRAPAFSREPPEGMLRALDRPPAKNGSVCRLTCWHTHTGQGEGLQLQLPVSREGLSSLKGHKALQAHAIVYTKAAALLLVRTCGKVSQTQLRWTGMSAQHLAGGSP